MRVKCGVYSRDYRRRGGSVTNFCDWQFVASEAGPPVDPQMEPSEPIDAFSSDQAVTARSGVVDAGLKSQDARHEINPTTASSGAGEAYPISNVVANDTLNNVVNPQFGADATVNANKCKSNLTRYESQCQGEL